MKMEEVEALKVETPVEAIRARHRRFVLINRRKLRDDKIDNARRMLEKPQSNHSTVIEIANKLKSKSSITASDLKLLQNALLDEPTTIGVVLNTQGALRGLVRELTGHDINKRIAACCVLCNMASVESEKVGCTVAKGAGSYLVAELLTLNAEMAVTCAWTLGNVAGCGARAAALLAAAGALGRLVGAAGGVGRGGGERGAALAALTQFAFYLRDDLGPEHLKSIIHCLSEMPLNEDTCPLLFILSCHKEFSLAIIPEYYVERIIETILTTIRNHLGCNTTDESTEHQCNNKATSQQCLETHQLIRVLANLDSDEVYSVFFRRFETLQLMDELMRLSEIGQENKSLMWLLGNMYRCGLWRADLAGGPGWEHQ